MTPFDPEEKIFSLSDLVWLFRKNRHAIIRIALVGCAFAAIVVFSKPVFYKAEATFKESAEQNERQGLLNEVVANMGLSAGAPQAGALMKSYQVLKPLIRRMGLQANVAQTGSLRRKWKRVCDIICAELGCKLDDPDSFRFSDLAYDGEKPLDLRLCFIDAERFEIRQKQEKTRGVDPLKAKKRIYSYLLRRGFSPEVVIDSVSRIK